MMWCWDNDDDWWWYGVHDYLDWFNLGNRWCDLGWWYCTNIGINWLHSHWVLESKYEGLWCFDWFGCMRNHRLRRSKASDIVTNGLVVHVDAANRSSYSGAGSTWFDLSGNNLNFTLTGSPTHSTNNGGYFTFNGSSQYANLAYDSKLTYFGSAISILFCFLTPNFLM